MHVASQGAALTIVQPGVRHRGLLREMIERQHYSGKDVPGRSLRTIDGQLAVLHRKREIIAAETGDYVI
ncbi:MAG: hypothetical protein JXB10_09020 [Pirellulales bacterium]|nr:hypothetical protein [Pirellulales bacterium]